MWTPNLALRPSKPRAGLPNSKLVSGEPKPRVPGPSSNTRGPPYFADRRDQAVNGSPGRSATRRFGQLYPQLIPRLRPSPGIPALRGERTQRRGGCRTELQLPYSWKRDNFGDKRRGF
jgi:hypothetical protein